MGGGLYFRRWDGSAWSNYVQLASTGLWPTITQAADGQAWMMWEDAGSLKMRHYTGTTWESAETLLVGNALSKGFYPNLKLGTGGSSVDWVFTSCRGAPFQLMVDGRSISSDASPTVSIDNPTEGETVVGLHTVQVHASDDNQVDTVELSIDGGAYQDITGSFDGTHYTYDWDTTTGYPDGTYTLQARATDDAAQTTYSTVRNVTVDNVNDPPVASFTYTCDGLTCDFDASGSSDPDGTIASYDWTFGDGGTDTGVAPSHIYGAGGPYTVILTVTDNEGATGQTSHAVESNGPPVAAFTYGCTDLMCIFDASGSSDSDGAIASYDWTFGDGGPGSGVGPSHTYSAGGTYTVQLTVTDDDGATDQTSQNVHVNAPPVAAFSYSCTGLSCTFDASGSSDSDGTIASYDWTFGDGGHGSVVGPSHTYSAEGIYGVILTVTDNEGATNAQIKNVTVEGGGGQTVHVGDLDGTRTSVRNTWTASVIIAVHDGSHALVNGATITGEWSQGAGGESSCQVVDNGRCAVEKLGIPKKVSSVVFTVTDVSHATLTYWPADNHDPDSDSDGTQITVPPPANQAPVADFSYTCTDLTCDFDAYASYDLDGAIVSYDWDFGDGSPGGSGETTSHTYGAEGTYAVLLTVIDDLGATGSSSQDVTLGASGGTMHVGDLDSSVSPGRNTRWNATVTITIHDQDHAPLPDAIVTGLWSEGATGSSTCTTGSSGMCSVTKANMKATPGSVTFTVESVTHSAHNYGPADNHDPDSDDGSDGTSITVVYP
jgi:PKD repeat protein